MVKDKNVGREAKTFSFLRQREIKTNIERLCFLTICLVGITYRAEALGIKSITNCGIDYFRYCSQFPVNSDEVRDCFRKNGHSLTDACVDALLADGEVTKEEVDGEREKARETKPVEEVKPPEPQPEVVTPPAIETPPAVTEAKPKESFARIIIGKVINKTKEIKTTVKKPSDKLKSYPLFLEPYTNVNKDTMGSTITNYGLYDR